MSTNMELAIEFANKVRAELRHLTSEEIADLTDGLEADIASSLDDGADIGTAEKYASDLLSAAGLEQSTNGSPSRATFDRVARKIKPLVSSLADLAPAWWVFRAWVAAQVIGYMANHGNTGRPLMLEWSEEPWLGFIIFAALLYVSVKLGRAHSAKLQILTNVSHVLLALAGLGLLFAAPRGSWFVYQADGISPTTTEQGYAPNCLRHAVPNVSGLEVGDAQRVIDSASLDYTFFSPEYGPISAVPPHSIVVNQDPGPGTQLCINQQIQLWVEWKLPTTTMADTVVGTTTTVKPKATTTTAP